MYDKKKKYINLYAAFDIYFITGKSCRLLSFINESGASRYNYLQAKIAKLNETIEYETKEKYKNADKIAEELIASLEKEKNDSHKSDKGKSKGGKGK